MGLTKDVGQSQKKDGYLIYSDAKNAENGTTWHVRSKDTHQKARAAYYPTWVTDGI
jgi:hypothetical protein